MRPWCWLLLVAFVSSGGVQGDELGLHFVDHLVNGESSLIDGLGGEFNSTACGNYPLSRPPASELNPDVLAAAGRVEALIKSNLIHGIPGASFAVTYNSRVLTSGGVGNLNSSEHCPNGCPVTADSPFFVGSVTKTFTAYIIYILHSKGKVNLETNLRELVGESLPKSYGDITLDDLLSHTAGLVRNTPCLLTPGCNVTNAEIFSAVWKDLPFPKTYKAGMPIYSNFGFALAGRLVAHHVGSTYEDLVQELILDPLGMKDTGFYITEANRDRFGRGYAGSHALPLPSPGWNNPAGRIYSTANDMAKYLAHFSAIFENTASPKLLPFPLLRRWMKPSFVYPGGMNAIGHPWEMFRQEGGEWGYAKTGGINGFYAIMMVVPNTGLGVHLSLNGGGIPFASFVGLAGKVLKTVGEPLMTQMIDYSTKQLGLKVPDFSDNFVGSYASSDGLTLKVSVNSEKTALSFSYAGFPLTLQNQASDPTDSTYSLLPSTTPWGPPCFFSTFPGLAFEKVVFEPEHKGQRRERISLPGLNYKQTFTRVDSE